MFSLIPRLPQRFISAPTIIFHNQNRNFATKLRDPNRPVRPLSPFFNYLQDFRKSHANKIENKQLVSKASEEWKSLNEKAKKPYAEVYLSKKKKYDAEFSKYRESGALDAWKRDPLKPKKPLTGFMRYAQEYRKSSKAENMKVTEVTKNAAVEYRKLSTTQRKSYDDAYAKEKVIYDKAMAEYKSSGKEQAFKEKTGIAAEERKAAEKLMKEKEAKLQAKLKEREKKATMKAKLVAEKMKNQAKKLQKQRADQVKKVKNMVKKEDEKLKGKAKKAKQTLQEISKAQKSLQQLLNKANQQVKPLKKVKPITLTTVVD